MPNEDDVDEARGIYRKFEVKRPDGSSGPGGKHEHCAYFVLDLEHDEFALVALRAYAKADVLGSSLDAGAQAFEVSTKKDGVMTDLVARARRLVPELMDGDPAKHLLAELADRVEALIKDRDNWQCQANAQCESARYQQKRIAELEALILGKELIIGHEATTGKPIRAALASTPEWKGR